ncbi:entericidin A/B family lipoprotein [Azospirillum ramasamyi]|uniref:Entericidin EcnAB n=1 Tax=Azospirillum ramasamyi TaxID=682998 RepID=A0A2U9S2D2_9PROT|nr:entericidin A/B family lipoprotein [Azospirillum ramasamyi]AWU93690.1 entericidin EcnAB [Azospirillum ramasamyi]
MHHAKNRRQRAVARAIPFPARELVILTFLMALAAMLSGCNTVEGVGQDVKAGGRAIERTVD